MALGPESGAPEVVRHTARWPVQARVVVQGERLPDGSCSFTHVVRVRKGQAVFESVLEEDRRTCTFTIAQHRPADYAGHVDASDRPNGTRDLGTAVGPLGNSYTGASYTTMAEWGSRSVPGAQHRLPADGER